MAALHAIGLGVTVNVHDNSGINSFEKQFQPLAQVLGLPPNQTNAAFNLRNETWAYAVEDLVLGDILQQGVDFFWIDWQQGGSQGGLSGDKQNPTMWLNHLRCTDRHRKGDDARALVLARWGGLGGHRYQVGFSGDVKQLTWSNLAYQPYFSVTAANVAHGFWSHDIEGPADDMEMYTRWIQAGAFSGVMRSHDRGMSAGECDDAQPSTCSVVQPWKVPPAFLPANVAALQAREELLPYIYTQARAAFDTGVGLIIPMYYDHPEFEEAYLTDANGTFSQYMFGPSILVAPIVTQGSAFLGGGILTSKTVWLPPGSW
jgi:alpha-glucosidase